MSEARPSRRKIANKLKIPSASIDFDAKVTTMESDGVLNTNTIPTASQNYGFNSKRKQLSQENEDNRPSKKRAKATKGLERSTEVKTIADLNVQHCLEPILMHLNLVDLLNVADTSELLRSAARLVFAKKYGDKVVVVNTIDSWPTYKIEGDRLRVNNMPTRMKILRCFGPVISKLEYNFFDSNTRHKRTILIQYISEYCAASLTELSFQGYEIPLELTVTFAKVEEVFFSFVRFGGYMPELGTCFPNVRKLIFNQCQANDQLIKGRKVGHMPRLEHLTVRYDKPYKSPFGKWNIINLLRWNPQLKTLRLHINIDLDILRTISEQLFQLESLHLTTKHWNDENTADTIHFKTVKQLELELICMTKVPKMPIIFDRLEVFTLSLNWIMSDIPNLVEFFKKHPSITKLNSNNYDQCSFLHASQIIAALPSLTELDLHATKFGVDEAIDLMKQCPLLKSFQFELSGDYDKLRYRFDELRKRLDNEWQSTTNGFRFVKLEKSPERSLQENEDNQPSKKRVEATSPERSIEGKTFADLNAHHCLEPILMHLNLVDLLNVADTSELLRSAARLVFAKKYGDKVVVVNTIDSRPTYEIEGYCLRVNNMPTRMKILRCFGPVISKLAYYLYILNTPRELAILNHYIGKYCAASLTVIAFDGYKIPQKPKITFAKVENVTFSYVRFGTYMPELGTCFPNVRKLVFNECEANDQLIKGRKVGHMPRLEHLTVGYDTPYKSLLGKWNIINLLRWNPQLKTLRLHINIDLDILRAISEHLLQLESLYLETQHWYVENTTDTIRFKTVKRLELGLICMMKVPTLPILFDQLEVFTFSLNYITSDILNLVEFIKKHPSISKLKLTEYERCSFLHVSQIVTALPSLTELDLDAIKFGVDEAIDLMKQCPLLKSFQFKFSGDYDELCKRLSNEWKSTIKSCGYVKLER